MGGTCSSRPGRYRRDSGDRARGQCRMWAQPWLPTPQPQRHRRGDSNLALGNVTLCHLRVTEHLMLEAEGGGGSSSSWASSTGPWNWPAWPP